MRRSRSCRTSTRYREVSGNFGRRHDAQEVRDLRCIDSKGTVVARASVVVGDIVELDVVKEFFHVKGVSVSLGDQCF